MAKYFGAFIVIIAIIAAVLIDFFWTKYSLEELSGKEVSTSTVLWTMMKTNKK